MINLMTPCRNLATVFALAIFASSGSIANPALAQNTIPSTDPSGSSVIELNDFADFADLGNVDNFAEPDQPRGFPSDQAPLIVPTLPTLQVAPTADDNLELPQNLNVLTRGPLHEAFATTHQANPQPADFVLRDPPNPIDELPPEYKPEGKNVQWIPGYWAWDDSQLDFIWISGIWRDVPPNRRWFPGYWNQASGGHQWVSGFWTEEAQQEVGYLPQPPTSIDQGPSTVSPGEEYFYVPGNWMHQNDGYRWLTGHWQPVVENWIWIPARYVWTPNGCVFQSGYWDYRFENRGTCFAPVQFNQPVYLAQNYRYQPSFAINLNVDFMTHLFVRPRCGHYFYGDWYASNFSNIGYRPWVSYSSHHRSYDPLLAYYRCRRSSFDTRYNVVQHLTRQHNFYVNNRDFRPRPNFAAQHQHAIHFQKRHGNDFRNGRHDYLRKSNYVRSYADIRNPVSAVHRNDFDRNRQRDKYQKVADRDRREQQRRAEQLANLKRERKRREISVRTISSNSGRSFQKRNFNSQLSSDRSRELKRAAENARKVADAKDRARRQNETRRRSRDQVGQDIRGAQWVQSQIQLRDNLNQRSEQAKRARDQQQRAERDRQATLRTAQRDQARRDQASKANRKLDQVRRAQLEEVRKRQARNLKNASRDQVQRDQVRRDQQNQARKIQQQQARRAQKALDRNRQQAAQQQKELAKNRQQETARRAQQDAARRVRQDAERRARQDQARRAQQEAARKAQQDRARQQTAQRNRQQQAQRAQQDAARKAQQDAARAAKSNQQSRSSRLRNRSKRKK